MSATVSISARQQILTAIQLNTNHQYALEKYNQRLAAEIQEIDKLLAAADVGESDEEETGDVDITGAIRPAGPIPEIEFLNPVSPFYHEAIKRSRYINCTITHPMNPRELEMLTEAVTAEFRRLRALEYTQNRTNEPIDLTADVSKLNWKTIAERVTDVSTFARTDRECKTKWLGYHRPDMNHDEWTSDELEKLEEVIRQQEKGKLDWVRIARQLATNRSPMDCMRKGLDRARHAWTPEADRKLVDSVQVYGLENWGLVALHVSPHVSSHQCQMRYIRSHDPALNKSAWTSDEDARLNTLIGVLGTSDWTDIARHMPGRTNDMCRERYTEGRKGKGKVTPEGEGEVQVSNQGWEATEKAGTSRRTDWTEEQDMELIRLAGELGSKWQKISEAMGGLHNNNQCRARFSRLRNENKVENVILADTRPRPNKWTEKEDAELIRMVGEMGKQWLKISKAMGGVRSNDQCRTRYSRLKKDNKVESIEADATPHFVMTPSASMSSSNHLSTPEFTSASQSSASTSTSVTTATPTLTLPKPRPRPKSKPEARSRTESPLSIGLDTSQPISSRSGTADTFSVLPVNIATGKCPSRRTTVNSEFVGAGTPVPPTVPNESQVAVGGTVLDPDRVDFQYQTGTETEPRDSSSHLRFSRRSQVQSTTPNSTVDTSQSAVSGDPPAILASNSRSSLATNHARDEPSNLVLLSPTETRATAYAGPNCSPSRKKERTRKITVDGNIPTIETTPSNPSGSSAVRRRSSRLSGKD